MALTSSRSGLAGSGAEVGEWQRSRASLTKNGKRSTWAGTDAGRVCELREEHDLSALRQVFPVELLQGRVEVEQDES